MLKESLITFKTAKLAKEKGFSVHISDFNICFDSEGNPVPAIKIAQDIDYWSKNGYPVVTQSLLHKWLREHHNIEISIQKDSSDIYHCYSYTPAAVSDIAYSKIYEEALERGLLTALNLI